MYTWPALVIAPQGRACSCTPSTTISSRRVDAHVSHTVTASYRHVRHGSHTCVLAWHALLGDTRCKTGKQTSVRCAPARPPFVAASRVPPRTSWAAKLGSLSFKNGLSSWSRIWTKFSAYCILHTIHALNNFLASKLGPFSDLRTWAVFGSARTTFQGSTCAELSKVCVTLETLIDNVAILFISYYDSTSHTQFVGHHARTHGPPRHDTHTCFGIGRASDS